MGNFSERIRFSAERYTVMRVHSKGFALNIQSDIVVKSEIGGKNNMSRSNQNTCYVTNNATNLLNT